MAFNLRRKLIHFYVKIVRAEGTPTYIARGWALGMFIGCVIPMSAHHSYGEASSPLCSANQL